jgi:hypothetical protein
METITLAGVKTQEELRTQVEVWLKTRQLLGHNIQWIQGNITYDNRLNECFVLYSTQTMEEYISWYVDFEIEDTGDFVRSIKYPLMEEDKRIAHIQGMNRVTNGAYNKYL